MRLPPNGRPSEQVLSDLDAMHERDAKWRQGRTFSLVYYAGDDVLELLHKASEKFFSENALNPMAFPSLKRMENEVLSMVADLFGAPDAVGSMTTGGNESVLLAVKTARQWARANRPHVTHPEMVLPTTVHPAFEKAAQYFDVKAVHAPVGDDLRVDMNAVRALVNDNTILLVGSAIQYPHGVIDPITELAALAVERGILCHVDACLGGLMLPFAKRLGCPIAPFDFSVPGVTSMSADLHKYGYAAKGASTVLYRERELRKHQFVVYGEWPGGLYASPSMTGTRAGGPIAAAWAVMNYLGEDGYLRLAKKCLDTARALMDGIAKIPGLKVLGAPDITVFAFASDEVDVYALADEMTERGWHLDRQQRPPALHMMITPAHAPHVDAILSDLRAAMETVKGTGAASSGTAAMYGMLGSLPDRTRVTEFLVDFLDGLDHGT